MDESLFKKITAAMFKEAKVSRGLMAHARMKAEIALRGSAEDREKCVEELADVLELVLVEYLDMPVEAEARVNGAAVRFRLIPAGEGMIGEDNTVRMVKIPAPFYMMTTPVTNRVWHAILGTSASVGADLMDCPKVEVSWYEATDFCVRATEAFAANGIPLALRLPEDYEWEYACRAGSTTKWCFGDDESMLGDYAWYDGNSGGKTHPVGHKKPNAWGLYDMHGNVWEWCNTPFKKAPDSAGHKAVCPAPAPQEPIEGGIGWVRKALILPENAGEGGGSPSTADGSDRVYRGGSWGGDASLARSANRDRDAPDDRGSDLGFRPVADVANGSYRVGRGGSWFNSASWSRSANRGSHAPGRGNANLGFRFVAYLESWSFLVCCA